jgi:hypothetical protein
MRKIMNILCNNIYFLHNTVYIVQKLKLFCRPTIILGGPRHIALRSMFWHLASLIPVHFTTLAGVPSYPEIRVIKVRVCGTLLYLPMVSFSDTPSIIL